MTTEEIIHVYENSRLVTEFFAEEAEVEQPSLFDLLEQEAI